MARKKQDTTPEQEVLDAPAKVAEYSAVDAGLAELRTKVEKTAYDITTTAGDKTARALRAECVSLRTSIEAKRKEAKAPLLERERLLDAEAKRITAEITAIETPIDAAIKAEEQRKADEKAAKERAEAEARRKIDQAIADIAYYPVHASGKTSAQIGELIDELQARALTEDEFGDRIGEAGIKKSATLVTLGDMRLAAQRQEVEAQRLADERAEAERVRQQQAEEAERINKARADLEQQQRELAARQEAAKPTPAATPGGWCETMERPKASCGCPDCGPSLIDLGPGLRNSPPECETCDDNGMIGGPSFYAPDEGGEPCPDCAPEPQGDPVSVSLDLADASDSMPGADDMIEVIAEHYDVPPFAAEAWLRAAFGAKQ